MRYSKLLLSAVAAATLALAGCGEEETTGPTNCVATTDCAEGEICHPTGLICIKTCTAAADCPDTAKNCIEITKADGTKTAEKVCQCQTDALCKGGDDTSNLVCNTFDNTCEAKCAADADCSSFTPARTCETATGFCKVALPCGGCPTGQTCDTTTNTCKPNQVACSATNQTPGTAGGPDTCAYGQTCTANVCADLPAATCTAASSITWDKTAQGPVITSVTATTSATSNTTTECGSGGPKMEATITYYAPNGWPASSGPVATDITKLEFRTSTGTNPLAASFTRNVPSVGSKFGTFVAGLCGNSPFTTTGRVVALKNASGVTGNPACLP